jgi:hypothetical protein
VARLPENPFRKTCQDRPLIPGLDGMLDRPGSGGLQRKPAPSGFELQVPERRDLVKGAEPVIPSISGRIMATGMRASAPGFSPGVKARAGGPPGPSVP